MRIQKCLQELAIVLLLAAISPWSWVDAQEIELRRGDHIVYIGNTTADRMQHHAWTETYIHALFPEHDLTFRNLGFPGDEVKRRDRSKNFGSPDEWMTKTKADVVFCFFGYNESLRGPDGLTSFEKDLDSMLGGMLSQKYNGKGAPRIVVFSPIAHEDLKSPHLPDGKANNANLAPYTRTMSRVCKARGVKFVDLFSATQRLYASTEEPLTLNGIHLLDHGNKAVASVIVKALFEKTPDASDPKIDVIRKAVLDKNHRWFNRYRVLDGYNVFGGRSTLNWHGQSNADVLRREMEILDVMSANRDKAIWSVARGGGLEVSDGNVPELLTVKTNERGKQYSERQPYISGQEGISKMKIAKGMEVNLFASEEMFPELVNPVQMAVDTDGRLFVSVWPSYPHWNPVEPLKDKIVCLPDEDGDGVADKCVVFAENLNSVTSFEFWGGGMLVGALPEIWFLKDTDGDDRADLKIRMLQGVSSADSHHSANAMVMGPDGWLYWSRGIFNIVSMETPTKTYRTGASGVHRFNPRTFEMEFHYPIGPNPHGDIFDQWGYQFANDGTGGTGCYVNIGKGVRNKQWFKKRMRPVAATGILSSSHFPEKNQGNFLICNTITDLAVLQHEVKYDGADITAVEIEPILISSDPNFRPTDVEIGGDGALYVSDWCNVLIGHMQHNIRDPNRDHAHGRIYRVTAKGRPLVERVKMKGKPIAEVLNAFYARENSTRYRARLELSGRDTKDIVKEVTKWASRRDPKKPDDAQALLECLWVLEEHRVPNLYLLRAVFQAEEPRVRAAAIRTLGHWGPKVGNWAPTLIAASRDSANLVRAEAVKAAVSFDGQPAAEVIFEVATRPTDVELDFVIKYARGQINVDKLVADAVASGKKLSTAAQTYVLRNASTSDILKLERTEAVYQAILSRTNVPEKHLRTSLAGLARLRNTNQLKLLLDLIDDRVAANQTGNLESLSRLLTEQPAAELQEVVPRLEKMAMESESAEVRRMGYIAWIAASGSGDDAFLVAVQSKSRLKDFLEAVPGISDASLRAGLYSKVEPLITELPTNLEAEVGGSGPHQQGIRVDYFQPNPSNVAIETLARMEPRGSGIVPRIEMDVPQLQRRDAFALRFTGSLLIPKSGRYTFSTASDDGSRLYIGRKLVVDNDGNHGMVERSGKIRLSAGAHPIIVTYYDNGGGDGLKVTWRGPGIKKQKIPGKNLLVSGGETIHDVAIRALSSIPGNERAKFIALTVPMKAGKNRASAVSAISKISNSDRSRKEVNALVDNLVAYLSEMPNSARTGPAALEAIALAKSLAKLLPKSQKDALSARLKNLDVRVIAIGTVPHRMIFDKERIVVQAGRPVEFRFSNTDDMPHNFAITKPGALEEVGVLAESTATHPDAAARQFIPVSDKILLASRLLNPSENQALSFVVPKTLGVYPYVCTYPGHWRRMYGALYVVDNLAAYLANPLEYLKAHPLPIQDKLLEFNTRGREWKYDELIADVSPLPAGRNFDVGKQLFTVSSCISCHKFGGEGQDFGPDLAKLEEKKMTVEHILRSLLEPSKVIDEKYQSYTFVLQSGAVLSGMIVEEKADAFHIVIDPIAKNKPTVIQKRKILQREKAVASIMPQGLLDRLSREEILDLIAYVQSRANKKHKLFAGHDHHNH